MLYSLNRKTTRIHIQSHLQWFICVHIASLNHVNKGVHSKDAHTLRNIDIFTRLPHISSNRIIISINFPQIFYFTQVKVKILSENFTQLKVQVSGQKQT